MTNTIAVVSAKGGVGKSTLAASIAVQLSKTKKVALIDVDMTNPCVKTLTGTLNQTLTVEKGKVQPVKIGNLEVASVAYLLPHNHTPVMWTADRVRSFIRQFIHKINWDNPDYFILDTPAGTEETLMAADNVQIQGAIAVTTPQKLSLQNTAKTVNMLKKLKIPIIGLIENMAGIFKSNQNAEQLCRQLEIPYLGQIAFNPEIANEADQGKYETLHADPNFQKIMSEIENFFKPKEAEKTEKKREGKSVKRVKRVS